MSEKKIYIENLGCAKNQVDAEVLLSYAEDSGYKRCENVEDANVIVVNSCGFIDDAKKESIDVFFTLKNKNPKAKIILSGCLAERYGKDMEIEEADAIFGNRDLSLFKDVLKEIETKSDIVTLPPYGDRNKERMERRELLSYQGSAYLKISEGCNHYCSYCAIPLIRGDLRSVPFEKIVTEARRLIDSGIYEINVIAQDLSSYGLDLYGKSRFVELMDTLSSLSGNFVLRMLYIHPDTFPLSLLTLIKERKNILPYFDIPIQHSEKKILSSMGRVKTGDDYLELFNTIRREIPESVIRTTLMLGYPGENDEDFSSLLEFVKKANLDWLGCFVYSREENTKAYNLISEKEYKKLEKVAKKRKEKIEEIQSKITKDRLNRFIGNEYTALVEEKIEGEDLSLGRIYSQAPDVDGLVVINGKDIKAGEVVKVKISSIHDVDLEGDLC